MMNLAIVRKASMVALFAHSLGCGGESAPLDSLPSADDVGVGPGRPDAQGGASDSSDAAADTGTPSVCPASTQLRKAPADCSGADVTAPAGFAQLLEMAAVGDVVSMAGLAVGSVPCRSVAVCVADDAPTLLFSDSPEQPAVDGVLYADAVPAGRYRLYVYHANGSSVLRKFPVVVLNQGSALGQVRIERRGLAAPSASYVAQGQAVVLEWLQPRAATTLEVPAGERVLLDPDLDALHAKKNQLVNAIYDVVTDQPLKFSFVSVTAEQDAAVTTAGLPLLTRESAHQRGTFAKAERLIVGIGAAASRGVRRVRLGTGPLDDALEGIDAATGDPQSLLGNYGLLYRLELDPAGTSKLAFSPRGGTWAGAALRAGVASALPRGSARAALATEAIYGGSSAGLLQLMSAGGSSLPVDVLLIGP